MAARVGLGSSSLAARSPSSSAGAAGGASRSSSGIEPASLCERGLCERGPFGRGLRPATVILPVVIVPVLSRHRVSTRARSSTDASSRSKACLRASVITPAMNARLVSRTRPSGTIATAAATTPARASSQSSLTSSRRQNSSAATGGMSNISDLQDQIDPLAELGIDQREALGLLRERRGVGRRHRPWWPGRSRFLRPRSCPTGPRRHRPSPPVRTLRSATTRRARVPNRRRRRRPPRAAFRFASTRRSSCTTSSIASSTAAASRMAWAVGSCRTARRLSALRARSSCTVPIAELATITPAKSMSALGPWRATRIRTSSTPTTALTGVSTLARRICPTVLDGAAGITFDPAVGEAFRDLGGAQTMERHISAARRTPRVTTDAEDHDAPADTVSGARARDPDGSTRGRFGVVGAT